MRKQHTDRWHLFMGILLVLALGLGGCRPVTAPPPTAAGEVRVPAGDVNEFWNGLTFAELTPAEQATWGVLGWNADNWDGAGELPETETMVWAELSAEQQVAALAVGYTQEYWDNLVIRAPGDDVNKFWNGFTFDELMPAEQATWGVLGWNAENWDGTGELPATETMVWAELSAEEQAAALAVGYTQEYWDNLTVRIPKGDVNEFWNGFAFAELTPAEQAAWAVLGWNAENWDGTGEGVATETMLWADLSAEQQAAATKLGYTQEYWDASMTK